MVNYKNNKRSPEITLHFNLVICVFIYITYIAV